MNVKRDLNRKSNNKKIPKATVHGDSRNGFYISTRDSNINENREEQNLQVIPPPQAPPQGRMLATEYAANLEKELYLLNAEIRFAKDRAFLDVDEEGMSVDSAIRRLRMACTMHEEETNKHITELQRKITEISENAKLIDQENALNILNHANENERVEMESLQNAFTIYSNEINLQNLQREHNNIAKIFHNNQKSSVAQGYSDITGELKVKSEELKEMNERINNLKDTKQQLLKDIVSSIREKRMYEEKQDFLAINSKDSRDTPPNTPLAQLHVKNAKLEQELKNMLQDRTEMEHQVDVLLEKNVQIKAEYNETRARLEEARRIKVESDKMFTKKYDAVKKVVDAQNEELEQLRAQKKMMKTEIADMVKSYSEFISKINDIQNQQQMLQEVINFKKQERIKTEESNEESKIELNNLIVEVDGLRKELDDYAQHVAKALEQKRRAEVTAEMNELHEFKVAFG